MNGWRFTKIFREANMPGIPQLRN